jgi:hypothetical protein
MLSFGMSVDCKDRPLEVQSLQGKGAAELEKIQQSYRAAVLKAKARSPLYAPHPYPKTERRSSRVFAMLILTGFFQETLGETPRTRTSHL